ncbi:long-chain acyl-CoA synthetase [Plasticicumulans lactativorans]|uniref:Long-chain-fatty-acid--CoA ligase n=1 Tax=Plasticicumulans lactativorans TaxID=1133106 RepID=A0A4R2LR87_9GAMM|nr:AMP-binding protein [Plasticicumulans lactativorans]TCO82111.1 long-chain acyl-CoA synthetase [Plasticicumulans lactativorans]
MERIWLNEYPDGVPADIDVTAYRSINEIFARSCERYRDRPAFSNMGSALSYGELDALSARFAGFLRRNLGLARGARVALMMPNVLQYPVALFGVLRAGLVVVNVNPLYTARELEHQLADSGAEAIVVLENFAHTLEVARRHAPIRHVVVTALGDLLPLPKRWIVNAVVRHVRKLIPPWNIPGAWRMRQALASSPMPAEEVRPEDIAFLQYTGGTTGIAKGAVLTHRNMIANLQQAGAWIQPALGDVRGGATIITALPLYHIFSLTANCLIFMRLGWCNALITNPRDIPNFIKELGRLRFAAITGVNTLFNALLNAPGFAGLDFSELRVSLAGGMALQRAVAERWHAATGCNLIEAYGLTETAPAVCINPLTLDHFNGSIGLPIPSTEISVRDENGVEVAVGEVGELCVRGPQVMLGYWQRPDETATVFTEDGFLHTGDMVSVDARGYVHLVDRKKDMILVSGFNVYPNEIEDVAMLHPGVLEAAAVGVPDAESGEVVKLVVVRKDPALDAETLREHCRANLTRYKVPRIIEFRTELPKTNVGKILRRALREEAQS